MRPLPLALILAPLLTTGCQPEARTALPEQVAPPAAARATVDYATEIQPLFDAHCISCHTGHTDGRLSLLASEAEAHLFSDRSQAAMPIVDPGQPDNSYLLYKLRGTHLELEGGEGLPMPPHALLPEETVDLVETWITEGAAMDAAS